MKLVSLGLIHTGNRTIKPVNVYQTPDLDGYKFYSAYDECNYIYTGYTLEDAIRHYIQDTEYQGFGHIELFTTDDEIKKQFEELVPWF